MIFVDAHCDTVTRIMDTGEELFKNTCHIDIERMSWYAKHLQFFAAFVSPEFGQAYAMRRAVQIIDKYYEQININKSYITPCLNYGDIEAAFAQGKAAALLSIEGGDALQGELSALRMFYRLGVRSICLTWNHRNEIADGVADEDSGGGLTPFGRRVVGEMNSLGMLVDLSHISEKGFWDVMDITQSPVIVSHSNARGICRHRRNLRDDQILEVKRNGGVMGINLYPVFLNDSGSAGMADIIRHIEHIASLAGEDSIGIGADFDGIELVPDGIDGIQDMIKVFNELARLNYTQQSIEKLAGANFMRVIQQVLG
ncbi:dipeptidase [Anaerobacterium chartisolvens]|uniref:Dipeptidase n=1 Tax=Anaerobacterium chartisolvens TaxID=1297424 RepID=A0A369BHW5_9FIRM|nr:dipeptidase [Anaerobacterium chartisolvens]RCX20047.1 dipeptidase [Anaerobacterium chartisolvens]